MKLPRQVSGAQMVRALARLGYVASRQVGSHVRLSTTEPDVHHVTVPLHDALRVGTLSAIVSAVAAARGLTKEQTIEPLFE